MLQSLFHTEIYKWSSHYNLDADIIRAIIQQESNWNPYAVRYEPNYRWLYEPAQFSKDPLISLATEINTQKISWGLGQIMGALAREQGHTGCMGKLLEPDTNIMHICIRISELNKHCNNEEEIFAVYNGGLNSLRKVDGHFKNEIYVKNAMSYLIKYRNT